MTDAHCHVSGGDPSVRELLIGRDFVGVHPWATQAFVGRSACMILDDLKEQLAANPRLGVGEIGLDRLKEKTISSEMRAIFRAQLALAFEFRRPVVLHGAKCWGEVVKAVSEACERDGVCRVAPPLLFHGFSRSDGLIPDIVRLGGFISVGPAVLNDHAVNYRALVKKIPLDCLLCETDRTEENKGTCPSVRDVLVKVAELRGLSPDALERQTDENAARLMR